MSLISRNPRAQDLACDEALVGLTAEEQAELEALFADGVLADHADREALARAAAAIAMGVSGAGGAGGATGVASGAGAMPSSLVAKLEQQAAIAVGGASLGTTASAAANKLASIPPSLAPSHAPSIPPSRAPSVPAPLEGRDAEASVNRAKNVVSITGATIPQGRAKLGSRLGWLAAAACLLVAVGALTRGPREVVVTKNVFIPHDVPTPPPAPVTPADARKELLGKSGTTTMAWQATKDPNAKGASGDVVWNAAEQKGAMRFSGLAKNDPRVSQYQLWIFDKGRDAKYPVDGGVFDVDTQTGDVIVPITARIPVGEATLFAVTIEKPGGVVVSKREHIVLTAAPPKAG